MCVLPLFTDAKLRLKALVVQLVLFFSKLQGSIIKALPSTGLFPCNPPITPQIYANCKYLKIKIKHNYYFYFNNKFTYVNNIMSLQ